MPDEQLEQHHRLPDPSKSMVPSPTPGAWSMSAACADPRLPADLRATFTADEPTDLEAAALTVCEGCPALEACGRYAAELGWQKVSGVWGGRRSVMPKLRPRRPVGDPSRRRRAA